MSGWTISLALVLGLGAGVFSGLFGVGGGLLFVPTLLGLGLGQLEAEATSLLAILPTAAVGAWRQHRYGNLRVRSALELGLASSLPEPVLRRLFGLFLLVAAGQLAWRARRSGAYPSES